MTSDEIEEFDKLIKPMIDDAVAKLGEHCDTVQIFLTKDHGQGTLRKAWGTGNWFARYGQVEHWVQVQRGQALREGQKDYDADES